jgi:hypothetical protein
MQVDLHIRASELGPRVLSRDAVAVPFFAKDTTMPARLGAAHWRARAEEARALAEEMPDEDSKWRTQRIAADYDKLAQRAEALGAERGTRLTSAQAV